MPLFFIWSDSVSSTEPQQGEQLYAAREPVFPRRVNGKFRNLKWIIMIVTLGLRSWPVRVAV
jgi:hypothetical protein